MSLGQALAAARRDAGMSLEQVSAATNLRRTVLAAMEDDDFRHCGGDFYVKAHVREIARVLGVAPEPFLALYAEQQPTVAGLDSSGIEPPRERIERGARRGPNWSAAMAVALVLVLGFGVYRVATRPSPATVDIAASPATPSRSAQATTDAPRPKPTPPARPTPSDAVAQVPRAGVDVRLSTAGGPSWVSVTNGGGKLLFRGLVPRGKTRTFTDKTRVRMTIGNAGAVTLVVNGRSLGAPGKAGTVARVDFGPRDPAAG